MSKETKEPIEERTYTFQLKGEEIEYVENAFQKSGHRIKSEFIRFYLKYGIEAKLDMLNGKEG